MCVGDVTVYNVSDEGISLVQFTRFRHSLCGRAVKAFDEPGFRYCRRCGSFAASIFARSYLIMPTLQSSQIDVVEKDQVISVRRMIRGGGRNAERRVKLLSRVVGLILLVALVAQPAGAF